MSEQGLGKESYKLPLMHVSCENLHVSCENSVYIRWLSAHGECLHVTGDMHNGSDHGDRRDGCLSWIFPQGDPRNVPGFLTVTKSSIICLSLKCHFSVLTMRIYPSQEVQLASMTMPSHSRLNEKHSDTVDSPVNPLPTQSTIDTLGQVRRSAFGQYISVSDSCGGLLLCWWGEPTVRPQISARSQQLSLAVLSWHSRCIRALHSKRLPFPY